MERPGEWRGRDLEPPHMAVAGVHGGDRGQVREEAVVRGRGQGCHGAPGEDLGCVLQAGEAIGRFLSREAPSGVEKDRFVAAAGPAERVGGELVQGGRSMRVPVSGEGVTGCGSVGTLSRPRAALGEEQWIPEMPRR